MKKDRNVVSKTLLSGLLVLQGGEALASKLLEEIVVTSQRRAESVQDVPIAISAFTGEALSGLGMDNADDLAAQTPGLQWKGAFEYSSPTIFLRGIGDNTFQANNVSAVGLYFDEVYVSSGSSANQALLDIDRVEVLKGPQGTLYGRNTTGGAINFVARKPSVDEGLSGDLSLTLAEYGQLDVEGAVNLPLTETSALRVAASVQSSDGPYRYDVIGQDGPANEAYAWRVLYLNDISDDFQLLLNFHGSDNKAGTLGKHAGALQGFAPCPNPGVGNAQCTDFFGFSGSDDLTEDHSNIKPGEDIESLGASLTLQWIKDDYTVTSISAYDQNDRDVLDDLDHSPGDVSQNDWFTAAQQFSQELRITSSGDEDFRWTAGAYYFREDLQSFQSIALRDFGPSGLTGFSGVLEGLAQRADQDNTSYALFAETYYDISDKLTLTVGARWTYEEKEVELDGWLVDVTGTNTSTVIGEDFSRSRLVFPAAHQDESEEWREWTGKVALDYTLNNSVLLFASAARGFKAGGYNGGAMTDQAEVAMVDPEFLNSYELGIKSDFLSNKVRLNASLFRYDFKEQQVFIVQAGAAFPVQTLSNAGESTVTGAEVDIQLQPTDSLYANLGVSWLDAEFDEFFTPNADLTGFVDHSGNALPAAPEFTANGLVRYSWLLKNDAELSLQVDFSYTDDQFFEATNNPFLTQDSYVITNLRTTYSWNDGNYSVALWGQNITDEEYVVDGYNNTPVGYFIFVPGKPRIFGLTFSGRF